MTLWCRLLGCDTYRERREHQKVPDVPGLVCRRCKRWVPMLTRSAEEQANVARTGRLRLPKAHKAGRVLPMRRAR